MKRRVLICLVCIFVLSTILLGLNINANTYATETSNNVDDLCQQYTDNDAPNGVSIDDYANDYFKNFHRIPKESDSVYHIRTIAPGEWFQNNCTYSGDHHNYFSLSISGDDNIVKLIPRGLFLTEGQKLYFGKEYGFYITTRDASTYSTSNVCLFRVEKELVQDYMFSISIKPILKMNYAAVSSHSKLFLKDLQNKKSIFYCDTINLPADKNECILPLPRGYLHSIPKYTYQRFEYLESEDIDVSDISFGANLYNANSLNFGDDGYSAIEDNGYFIIGNEYEFSVSKKDGSSVIGGINEIAGVTIPIILNAVPVIGSLASQMYTIVDNTIVSFNGIKSILAGEVTYSVTNKNYIFNNNKFFTTRATQLQNYGQLVKSAAIAINTEGDNKLYFSSGDYAKGTYTLSHTDKPYGKEYCKLDACVVMKITENNEEKVYASNNFTFDISPQETHTLNVMQEHDYYMLPNGTMKFAVNPEFGGEYIFDVSNNDVELLLDGVVQPKSNGKYTVNLQGNKQQIITLRNNGTKIAIGKITSDCAEIFGSHTIGAGQSKVYKLSGSNKHYILATQNPNVQFTILFDKNMSATNVFSNATECQAFTYGKDCYVSVKNMSSTQQTINVIAREAETMSTSGKTLTAETGQKYLKFSFKASTAGNYTFKFDYDENGETFGARVYNATFDRRTYTVRTSDTFETYKVALSANETVNIVIERYTNLDRAWSSNCTVEASPREMWVIEGRETKLNEYLVYRGQHLRLSLKTQYGDVIPVTKDVISDRKYDLTITEGQLIVDIFAQVGVIPLHFIIDTIEYDNNGNPTSGHDEVVFTVHVAINQSVNTETLTHVNDENGVFVSMVDDTYLTQVEITVVNGNNNATTTLKKGTMVDILKLMKYDDSVYATTIKTNRALYKYKDSTGRINTEWVQSHYYWFNIADIETNHLFGDESVDTGINIYNRRHLQNLNKYTQTTNKVFYIQNDIDTKGIEWTPIRLFYGTLYGQNHAIKNLTITIPQSENVLSYYGMFALLYGTVLDLKLESLNFSAEKFHQTPFLYIGGLAGYSHAIISNVTVSGKLTINRCYSGFGGIVGYNEGQITSSVAKNLTMFGNGDMGGIVGVGHAGAIRDCHTENTKLSLYVKTINRSVGGIAGVLEDIAIIERCYNTNTTIKIAGYHNIAWDQIAPHMGIIVGGMSGGTVKNVNVKNTTLDYGDLPEKDRIGLGAWHYPRKYIGAYGNGAAGYVENNYTITNTNWNP